MDLAFLIQALISRSSFSSDVMTIPRYLKLCVKQMCWLSGRVMSGGSVPLVLSSLASLSDAGENIASVLYLVFFGCPRAFVILVV